MKSIVTILREILDYQNQSQSALANELNVSPATISRWLSGESAPRPSVEGQLREMHRSITPQENLDKSLAESQATYSLRLFEDEQSLRNSLNETLSDLREALHRRGRLSSRNAALDELSKLLFSHIMTPGGLSSNLIADQNMQPAVSLVLFVENAFKEYLPASLGYEIPLADFQLKLKPQENNLARDIISAFERLAEKNISLSVTKGYDVLNEVFGSFLANSFANEKELGQYLTPSIVVNFMVNLAIKSMSSNEVDKLCHPDQCVEVGLILDPSCGVASFLTEFVRVLTPEVLRRHGKNGLQTWLANMVSKVLVGLDKSERMVRLALTNMAVFGFPAGHLHLCDSLSRSGENAKFLKQLENGVHLILTNPPFGAEFSGSDLYDFQLSTRWSERPVSKINSELLFIERYMDWLKPGGQFFAIVPDSVLTNKGIYENLRKRLANSVEVCSVVSLPDVTFAAAGTNTKTSILHIRKSLTAPVKCKSTFFAICNDIGYSVKTKNAQRTKKANGNGNGELPKILEEFSLPYHHTTAISKRVDNVAQSDRWDAKYHISLPSELELRIIKPTEEDVFIQNVADLVNDRTDPRRWGKGHFQYIEISDINGEICTVTSKKIKCAKAPSRARKIVRRGDVLLSTVRPERKTIGVVGQEQDGAICSTGIAVLRPKRIHPLLLAYLLKTEFVTAQITRNTLGIAYPAVEEQCLLTILLPINNEGLFVTENLASEIINLEEQLSLKRKLFADSLDESIYFWSTKTTITSS